MYGKEWCVYKHTNKTNGKCYIGITSKRPEVRWAKGVGYQQNKYFWNAIQKYGWDGFDHEILLVGLSREEACSKEIELIGQYGSYMPNGYNLTIGGEGSNGWKMTAEQRAKISARNKGKKRPPEIGEMIRRRSLGKKASPETKAKMSAVRKGKYHTEETKQKLSKIMKDKGGFPQVAIDAAAEKHKRPVAQYSLDDEFIRVWSSAMDAEREGGFIHNAIARCARGKSTYHKGYKWSYFEEV